METPVIDKIRKLLAHATSAQQIGNADEAAAFFARAQAIATQYRIEIASVEVAATEAEDPMVGERVDAGGKRVMGWKKSLAWGLQHPLGVYVVFHQGNGAFTFAGRRGNVQTAIYLYQAVCAEIERLAKTHARGRGAAYANAFKLGAACTVANRLAAQHRATMADARASGANESALVRVERSHDEAADWFRRDHRVTKAAPSRYSDANGYDAGRRAGEGINIGGNAALGRGNLALGRG